MFILKVFEVNMLFDICSLVLFSGIGGVLFLFVEILLLFICSIGDLWR